METINNLAMATFQLVILFTVAKFISFVKFNLRDYFIIVGIIIPTMFLYYFYGSRAVLIPTFSSIIFLFFKLKYYAIVTILVTMIIMYLSNFATVGLFLTLRKYTTDPAILLPLYILSFSSVSLLATYLVRISLKKFKKSYLSLNKTYMIIISFVLFATFAFFYIYSTNTSSNGDSLIPYALVFIGLIIFISVVILIMSLFTLKEMKYKRNQEEIETYYEYTLKIEAINNEMRKFRHDYVNILTTLSEYIREDDMIGLRAYFNKNIVPMKDNLQMNAIKLNGIENLKVREIKGLITAKILRAQEMNIPISIEIPDEVSSINLNMIDLSRSIGIILDNAIEASTEIDDPIIRVAFIESENSVTFIVMNKCADDIPRIHELFQESFSTKGEGRGLGLSTLKEIALATDNPYEVLEQAKNMNDIGCYFLDIQLSTDINGIKLGSEIRKHDPVGNIIFVTSHSELTYLTFVYKVAAMDFIFKDDPAELRTRIIDCLETAHTRLQLLSKDNSVETIELKRGSNSVYVQYDDIMFFESSTKSHRLIAHLDNRQIEFYGNLKELSQLDDRFFRCHNSFVVNRHNIESIDSKERIVYFKNKEHCYASVRNVKKI